MADQDLDRNEAATPYKLEKAREKGQVSKSADVVSAAVLLVAVLFLTSQAETLMRAQFRFDQALFLQAFRIDEAGAGLLPLLQLALRSALALLLPLFAAILLAAVVGNLMQTGPVLSFEPLKVDFQRINPVTGFKRIFSMRTLFDGARACIKLMVLAGVSWLALRALLPHFHALAGASALAYALLLIDDLAGLGLKMVCVLALVAMLDLLYTRREFAKKMRMSVRERKDETKHREGDPRIRARLRQLRVEMLKRSASLRRTKEADVVITNPTHVAVALRYEHGEMTSPQLLAKGAGRLAKSMRQIAARHQIPVVQNPPLARRLMRELDVDQPVPEHLYAEVARIIVWPTTCAPSSMGTSS